MEKETVVMSSGPGILSTLGIVFVVLKLVGTISWSWWWVLAPFWGPLALMFGIVIIVIILVMFLQVIMLLAELIN